MWSYTLMTLEVKRARGAVTVRRAERPRGGVRDSLAVRMLRSIWHTDITSQGKICGHTAWHATPVSICSTFKKRLSRMSHSVSHSQRWHCAELEAVSCRDAAIAT